MGSTVGLLVKKIYIDFVGNSSDSSSESDSDSDSIVWFAGFNSGREANCLVVW